jgi:hypothetical protein
LAAEWLPFSEDEVMGTPMASDSARVFVGSERMDEGTKAGGGSGMPGDGGRDELDDVGGPADAGGKDEEEDEGLFGNGYSKGAVPQFVVNGVPTIWSLGEWRMREDMSDSLSFGEAEVSLLEASEMESDICSEAVR